VGYLDSLPIQLPSCRAHGQEVFPKSEAGLRSWVGVGGSPESVVRTARYGLPVMLAIIGGDPERFLPYVDLYQRALEQLGQSRRPIGVHSPGYVAPSDEEAIDQLWPYDREGRDRMGAERGWPPVTRAGNEQEISEGSLLSDHLKQSLVRSLALFPF
jgi:alkanesulfonate monooxygenase SsuD/methylene tetrahydromethanopterin reductase-like flavin-dependent oxidoreductase (luciferase family)